MTTVDHSSALLLYSHLKEFKPLTAKAEMSARTTNLTDASVSGLCHWLTKPQLSGTYMKLQQLHCKQHSKVYAGLFSCRIYWNVSEEYVSRWNLLCFAWMNFWLMDFLSLYTSRCSRILSLVLLFKVTLPCSSVAFFSTSSEVVSSGFFNASRFPSTVSVLIVPRFTKSCMTSNFSETAMFSSTLRHLNDLSSLTFSSRKRR